MSPRICVPEAHLPTALFPGRVLDLRIRGRRWLCSGQLAVAVEPIEGQGDGDDLNERLLAEAIRRSLRFPRVEPGVPFLIPEDRALSGPRPDIGRIPRNPEKVESYAISVGPVFVALRFVAVVNWLFPGCAWYAEAGEDTAVARVLADPNSSAVAVVGVLRAPVGEGAYDAA